jgi:hypothetical protein
VFKTEAGDEQAASCHSPAREYRRRYCSVVQVYERCKNVPCVADHVRNVRSTSPCYSVFAEEYLSHSFTNTVT